MRISRRERFGIFTAAVLALFVISLPGTASAKDSNKDRIPDRWERANKLTLKKDQRKLDQDRDGLRNRGEWLADTNPRDKDSDDDGVSDLKEKAGVISAWDAETGELTLTLYAGGELSGTVDEGTRVKCESGDVAEEEGTEDGTEEEGSDDAENFRGGPGSSEGEGHEGHGNGEGRGHGQHGCGGDCSVEDLAEGVEVTEATIKYTASGKVFRELEIVVAAEE